MWGFRWLWCALYSFWVCSKLSMWKDMASDQNNFSKRQRPVSVLAALKHMVWFLHSEGTQSDLRRSHSRGQTLLGRTYLRCLEPGALVLLDSCDAAHSCKLFSKSSLTGSLIFQYPLNEKIAAEPLASDGGSPIMVSEPFVHPLTAFGIGRLCFVYQNLDSSL